MARKLSEDERRLWDHVAAQVTPLRPAAQRQAPTPAPQTAEAEPDAAAKPTRRPTAAAAPPPLPVRPVSEGRGRLAGVDRRTAERLRRGQIAIEARLDLHGLTRAEAHERLRGFVRHHHAAGRRCLLVITGKGRGAEAEREVFADAEAPGILRRQLPRWLAEPDLRPMVLAMAPAIPPHGGAGAAYILLRRQREPKS